MVAAHQQALNTPGAVVYATRFFASAMDERTSDDESDVPPQQIDRAIDWCRNESQRLDITRLFHVTESMAEVAKIAAQRLPEGLRLTVRSCQPSMGYWCSSTRCTSATYSNR